jgi:response regulator NasT
MTPSQALRIVVIAPDSLNPDAEDTHEIEQAERSRQLRISLLENGYNIIAVLPTDTFLGERIAQLQPDMIVGRCRKRRPRCARARRDGHSRRAPSHRAVHQ